MSDIKTQVHTYIDGVLDGLIPSCEHVKRACQRHLDDLKHAKGRGIYFDERRAMVSVGFFRLLRHSKGEWGESGGKRFELSDWQLFIVWCLTGWKNTKDGYRRFRICWLEVARKNGKTTFAAGLCLLFLIMDFEPGPEVYTAATKLSQANISHKECVSMVKKSKTLRKYLDTKTLLITYEAMDGIFIPLCYDPDKQDGFNPHCVLLDEVHEHPNRLMWDVIISAVAARRQPMIICTTTAGDGTKTETICRELHDYMTNILDPDHPTEDDTYFGFIACAEEGDDWTSEEAWEKANPNYGVSVYPDTIAALCKATMHSPAAQYNFRRKHLNEWVGAVNAWLDPDLWPKLAGTFELTKDKTLYLAIDLATTNDLCSVVAIYREDDCYHVKPHFWITQGRAEKVQQDQGITYHQWEDAGWVTLTDTLATDYRAIRKHINDLSELGTVQSIAYDPYNASHMVTELEDEDGFEMIKYIQTAKYMGPAIKEVERLMLEHKIEHDDNPCMQWNINNCALTLDSYDNPRLDKKKSAGKIDGAVAFVMAVGIAMRDGDHKSVYEERGMIVI